jgi:transposase-like protein
VERAFTKDGVSGEVLDQGYSHVETSRSIGVGESLMRRWVQQLQLERQGVTPQGKAITPDQQRIPELEQ